MLFRSVLFLPIILLNQNKQNRDTVAEGRILPNIKEISQMLMTTSLLFVGWIIFRLTSLTDSVNYAAKIFSASIFEKPVISDVILDRFFPKTDVIIVFAAIPILMITEWFARNKQHGLQIEGIRSKPLRWIIYLAVLLMIWVCGGQQQAFIYFQF